MSLKTFRDEKGMIWTVWRLDATVGRDVRGMPKRWLVFQDEPGTERRRLTDFPDQWESLSDDRLATLCQAATPGREWGRPSPPGGMSQVNDLTGIKTED